MKIILRKWNCIDFFRYLKLTLDKSYSKELPTNPFTYFFLRGIKFLFVKDKEYKFAILVEDKFAGSIAIFDKNEIGYFILREFRKKGIISKALKKIIKMGFDQFGFKKLTSITDNDNKISQKILKKAGFRIVKRNKKDKSLLWEIKK